MSRAAFPAEDICSWFPIMSSNDEPLCAGISNLNLTTSVISTSTTTDHVCMIALDAKTVLSPLDQWFEDYNEYHSHKG